MSPKLLAAPFEVWLSRAIVVVILASACAGLFSQYSLHILTVSLIFALLAFGQDIAFGLAGQLVLCEGAFFGFGAYASALLVLKAGMSAWSAIPIATIATSLLGVLVGVASYRTSGHYLAMLTLSFSMIFYELALNWDWLTGGAMGLGNIPRPTGLRIEGLGINFENDVPYIALCAVLVLGAVEFAYRLRLSTLGRRFLAIREDELASSALGINLGRTRVAAITLAATLAGMAGPLYAHYQRLISPEDFGFFQSVSILLMVIVGGRGSVVGPLIGALAITVLPEYLRAFAGLRWITFGTLLVIFMIFLPGGIRACVLKMGGAALREVRPL